MYVVSQARGTRLIAAFRMIVRIEDGSAHDVVLGPERGSASVSGTLQSDDALPDLPVMVAQLPRSFPDVTGPIPSWGAVASGGTFRLEGLPSGTYKAMVQYQDEETGTSYFGAVDVVVAAGASHEVTIPITVR